MSLTYPDYKCPTFGLIWKIFLSIIAFSYAYSSVGSPGSAQSYSSILLSDGNLKA